MSVFSVSGGWGIEWIANRALGNTDFLDFVDSWGELSFEVGDWD